MIFRFEKFFCILGDNLRIVVLAGKNIEIHRVGLIGKMPGYKGSFDELQHRKAAYPRVLAEMHYSAFSIAIYLDPFTEFIDKLFYFFCISDGCGIASMKINTAPD